MTSFQIIALYAALNLILACVLMLRVGNKRISQKVSLGDGGDAGLRARIRAHGNYIENAPLALIGLFALAFMNAHVIALHIFGTGFLLGRIAHAHGMDQKNANGKGRVIGAVLTLLTLLGTGLYLLFLVFTFKSV
jgi:uncharacterized membrane protein YecN with MAPEG domain